MTLSLKVIAKIPFVPGTPLSCVYIYEGEKLGTLSLILIYHHCSLTRSSRGQ